MERLATGVDVLRQPADLTESDAAEDVNASFDVLIVSVGAFAENALRVAQEIESDQLRVTVVDPRWVIPISVDIIVLAAQVDLVVVYEDGVIRGGVGSAVAEALSAAEVDTPVRMLAFPDVFPLHGTRGEILAQYGLDAVSAAEQVREWICGLADNDAT